MASPTPTFATLRALHLVIADALDEIQRVFSQNNLPDPPPSPVSQCSSPVYPSSPVPSPVTSPFPATPPASFPPTPLSATFPSLIRSLPHTDTGVTFMDYPSPDLPLVSNSPSEQLALHPDAAAAASRIVAACGQMSNIVHKPFLSLCDAIMSFNLPACMRLVEHLHVAEILREAEENRQRCLASGQEPTVPLSGTKVDLGLGASGPVSTTLTRDAVDVHVQTPAAGMEWILGSRAHKGIGMSILPGIDLFMTLRAVHVLRLLSTHHIFRETAPDTFSLTRVASLLDSGKSVKAVFSNPETKYDDTGGIPAFVALITDELFKSSAYLTEAFTGVQLPILSSTPNPSFPTDALDVPSYAPNCVPRKSFRHDRFSKAMVATTWWEAPKAILSAFDWYCLPKGSTIVDVGGGIGSTTMTLARALNDPRGDSAKKQDDPYHEELQPTSAAAPRRSKLPSDPSLMSSDEPQHNTAAKNDANLRFVVQDRPVVTALGIEAWRSKCPEMLESGQIVFQDQDFFEPQPHFEPPHLTRHPAVYILRVILHDWPDELARRILINLRVASNPETRLVIAEHVLPLACVDEDVLDHVNADTCEGSSAEEWTLNSILANIDGAERTLVPPPLLSNLGKASASAYWMDLIMHISLNGKERTLREFCALALSAGWRVTRMTRPEGSLFAYLVCEPITLPDDAQAIYNAVVLSSELSTVVAVLSDEPVHHSHVEPSRLKRLPARPVSLLPSPVLERSSSRCGTPTFGSRILLPKDEELQSPRTRGAGAAKKWLKSKGLGVRSVVMQKAEKQREDQNLAKGAPVRDNSDGQSGVPASASHIRVWWKKSPPSSTSNSSITVHELNGEAPEYRVTGRGLRGTFKSSDSPSTPSPRVSPGHQNWPSTESAALPIPEASPPVSRARRPSVASITRKLSFATFGRRPSIADITEPLPTPPPSATLTELAPPPTLRGDTGRGLKHLPSLPTLERSEVATRTMAGQPAISRRPSLSFTGRAPPPPPAIKSAHPRRPDPADSPKSTILKSRTSPYTSKQSSPDTGHSAELTSIPRHQRRVTLSNSPGASSSTQAQSPSSVSVLPNPAGAEVKRIPSVPKLPRRLSIPMLRRKQSQSAIQDVGNEG
ncbi:hypothetical protein J3R83DRAFT_7341 [Lanmaoa asiatica]|nr:hypothetical protein J3R83DRAFT_7341 [Lanmaoa asiatica]